jgi:hypothetical protein
MVFYRVGGTDVGTQKPSSTSLLTHADSTHLRISSVDATPYARKSPSATETDDVENQTSSKAEKQALLGVIPVQSELYAPLLPSTTFTTPVIGGKRSLEPSAKQLPIVSGRDFATPTLRLKTSGRTTKAQKSWLASEIQESEKALAEKSNGNHLRKEIFPRYEAKWIIPVRRSANFAAPTVKQISRGTSVNLIEFQGSWAKVKIRDDGVIGFVRKEFLDPVNASSP